jgi:hypothetical protein
MVGGLRLRPPVQIFQALSHLTPGFFAGTTLTVRTVDSDNGTQIALYLHNPPRRIHSISPWGAMRLKGRELIFEAARDIMPQEAGSIKSDALFEMGNTTTISAQLRRNISM